MYRERFPQGSLVRIISRQRLTTFAHEWKLHHKLEPEQLQHAGQATKVKSVGFYHGGDPLYQLDEIAGIWHECCLEPIEDSPSLDTHAAHPLA